ncbi:MAG: prepilin-type N-terminal cleavage/methylation domain-containing protein [Planctomycetota bacterium]
MKIQSKKLRRGFTLMELMLVISIIGVLSGLSLAVMRSATLDAKAAATRSRIRMINEFMKLEAEEYEVRRIPISVRELATYAAANPARTDGSGNPVNLFQQVKNLRRRILQEVINSELPRPILSGGNFVANPDVGIFPSNISPVGSPSLGFRNWLSQEYPNAVGGVTLLNRLNSLTSSKINQLSALNGNPNYNLPSELLYVILAQLDVEGQQALDLLGNRAVGDTDLDGIPEVVDAYGNSESGLQLLIYQVDVEPAFKVAPSLQTAANKDIYPDFNSVTQAPGQDPDFDVTNLATLLPQGYDVLDPTIPREVGKIRFEVISPNLGREAGER